jgi:integrase
MRQGEILGLCWNDVDGKTVRIRRSLITGWGKQTYEGPKTAKGRRTITLTTRAAVCLAAHKESQRAAGLYAEDGPIFTNRVGNPVHPKHLLDRSFKPLLAKAGLPPIRFHDLRHTAATLLLGQNVHPKVVQELLGHANISITLDTYSHLLPGWGDAAAGAMNDALGG